MPVRAISRQPLHMGAISERDAGRHDRPGPERGRAADEDGIDYLIIYIAKAAYEPDLVQYVSDEILKPHS